MRDGKEILRRLSALDFREDEYASLVASRSSNPFETLVATVISQNTNDKNTMRAMENLKGRLGYLTPEKIIELSDEELEELIRPAGLHKQKARYLKLIAERLSGGVLEEILSLETEEARNRLLEIPGIGPKTADVLLSFMGRETVGVDRHIARVSSRLGISDGSYEGTRRALMDIFDKKDYLRAHLLLIKLGREYCRPRNPRCGECPLRDICDFSHSLKPGDSY